MVNHQITKLFIFIIKFLFLPSGIFGSLYWDLFGLDLFNTKKIERMSSEIVTLKDLNQKKDQLLILQELELKKSYLDNLDTRQIVLYSTYVLITGIVCFYVYTFFNNGNASALIVEHASKNTNTVISHTSESLSQINNMLSDQTTTLIKTQQQNNTGLIGSIAEFFRTLTSEINTAFTNQSTAIGNNQTILNNSIGTSTQSIIDYVYENTVRKLDRVISKLDSINNIIEKITPTLDDQNTNIGYRLGGDPLVSDRLGETGLPIPPAIGVEPPLESQEFDINPFDLLED